MHNRLVRSDAFDQAVAALRNLSGRGLDLTVNCVVTRQNLAHLRGLVDLVAAFADVTLKFSMVEPKGGAARNFELLVPRIGAVADAVLAAAAHARERGCGSSTAGSRAASYLASRTATATSAVTATGPWSRSASPICSRSTTTTSATRRPALAAACAAAAPGSTAAITRSTATASCARSPIARAPTRSTTRSRPCTRPPKPPVPCAKVPRRHPVGAWPPPVRPPRPRDRPLPRRHPRLHRRGDRRGQARTRPGLRRRRSRPRPQDFARELVPLARCPLCAGCPHLSSCTGMFEPVFEDIFTRDDAVVRARLAELTGDVLDLGCGDAPYLDVLAPRIAAGAIRYTGVDPDEAALARLRARLPPGAGLEVGDAEALELGEHRFDAVTILRSYNHLRDPDRVLVTALSRLRRGGVLVVCDNTAFGLARTPRRRTAASARAPGASTTATTPRSRPPGGSRPSRPGSA
ncbi:methyltransferase domain-containing protein [Nannocystis pusilla]|uniref:class I SAM-dependent methyltransferase n=1 Tax=Nannocystis pusilla TaxID=889268 RepID=UPI003B79B6FD